MTAYVTFTIMIMMLTIFVLYMSKDSELAFAAAQRLTWTNPRDDAEEQNDNIFFDESSDGEGKFFYEGKNTYGETVDSYDKVTGKIDPNAEQRGCIANPNGGACVASDVLVKTIGVNGLASANGGFDQVSPVYLGGEKTLNPLNGYEPEATASEERILFSSKMTPEQEANYERIKEAVNRRYAREEAAKNATWADCIPAICIIAALIVIVVLAVHFFFH